jgi:hypothetical protein
MIADCAAASQFSADIDQMLREIERGGVLCPSAIPASEGAKGHLKIGLFYTVIWYNYILTMKMPYSHA